VQLYAQRYARPSIGYRPHRSEPDVRSAELQVGPARKAPVIGVCVGWPLPCMEMAGTFFRRGNRHMRFVSSVTVALTVGFTAAMYAQEVKSTTKITGDNVKPVSFTGCLQTGTQASSYVLDKVVPIGQTTKTEATGTAGEITKTTTTTYALV